MKTLLIILVWVMGFGGVFASVKLTGFVGKYEISMELVKSKASKEFGVRGRYNYAGKTQSLDLKGNMRGRDVLHLQESFAGKPTGEFFLQSIGNATWSGKWVGGSKVYGVELHVQDGEIRDLEAYSIKNEHWNTTSELTGTYVDDHYGIYESDLNETNPRVEVYFAGGVVTIEELGDDQISFRLARSCGRFWEADAEGTAIKVSEGEYRYMKILAGQKEACELTFSIHDRIVKIGQVSAGEHCGFGARGFASGNFVKVNEMAIDGELTVQRAIGR